MNCFQNVSLTYRFQWGYKKAREIRCCELLSKCIFDISFSMSDCQYAKRSMLWIAFKMYLWHIVFNDRQKHPHKRLVVNCFQNVSLTYRFQSNLSQKQTWSGCELLSKCIFDISFSINCRQLRHLSKVVNCFQNVSLTYRFQYGRDWQNQCGSCELLSKCIFDISFSIIATGELYQYQLWIAFKMYLWHIVFNRRFHNPHLRLVVNCFQNVSLTYRFQWT